MRLPPLFNPADFRIATGVAHLCAAGETPFLRQHDAAFGAYAEDKSDGPAGRHRQEAMMESARARAARLFHVQPADIGFVSSVAEGVSMVVESLDWASRKAASGARTSAGAGFTGSNCAASS